MTEEFNSASENTECGELNVMVDREKSPNYHDIEDLQKNV